MTSKPMIRERGWGIYIASLIICLDKQNILTKNVIFSYLFVLTYVLGSQKNRLIEMVLLSTHNTCIGCKVRKLFFDYSFLSGGLVLIYPSKYMLTCGCWVLIEMNL